MSRPLNNDIKQGQQSWDGDLRDNLRQLYKTPFPVPNGTYELADGSTEGTAYLTKGGLPSAASHEGCIAAVNVSGTWSLYYSNGSAWRLVVLSIETDINVLSDSSGGTSGGDSIAAITDPVDTPATADALRDDLVANTIPDIANAIATLAEKVNDIVGVLGLDT